MYERRLDIKTLLAGKFFADFCWINQSNTQLNQSYLLLPRVSKY